jgi:ABC-type dipeptide/oligopeptide/nickel transport system permease component
LFTFLIIVALLFFVLHAMPGDITSSPKIKETQRIAIREKYHLDEPKSVQFVYFIGNYLKLDFGYSFFVKPGTPVNEVIMERLPITIQLNAFAALLTLPMGMLIGITMALKKNTLYDNVVSSLVVLFIAAPSFVVAAVLQYFIGFKLQWLPLTLAAENTLNWTKFVSMILPILSLSFGNIASISRMLRAELSEALTSDYMLLAKSKGLTYRQSIVRHALRNACVPMAAQFLYLIIYLFSGSVVIENIFGVPGLSKILVDSINSKDHWLTLGVLYFYVIIGLVMAIAGDLSYGLLDPRIRMGGKHSET